MIAVAISRVHALGGGFPRRHFASQSKSPSAAFARMSGSRYALVS